MAYGNTIAMEENLESSLSRIFGGRVERSEKERDAPTDSSGQGFKRNACQGQEHFQRAQKAMRAGDWALYGSEMEKVGKILRSIGE